MENLEEVRTHTLTQEEASAMVEELLQASKTGNVKQVKSLLDTASLLFLTAYYKGNPVLSLALLYAEKGGHSEVVEILKVYFSKFAGGWLLLFSLIPFFGINFICGLYVFLKKKKVPTGEKIYKYNGFSRIVALIGVIGWVIVILLFVAGIIQI